MQKNNRNEKSKPDSTVILSVLSAEQRYQLMHCDIFDELASTNQYLLNQLPQVADFPRVCFARRQTQGRGRRGRSWVSSSEGNIYMSLALLLNSPLETLPCFSLLTGIAIVRVLRKNNINAALKWPNDVLVEGKKIAGVLLESRIKPSAASLLVIGVGLNVDMQCSGAEIEQEWTDVVQQRAGESVDRDRLAGELLSELMFICEAYQSSGFMPFVAEWQSLDLCYRQPLSIYMEGRSVAGLGCGINEDGYLCVDIAGEKQWFCQADVTVRLKSCC